MLRLAIAFSPGTISARDLPIPNSKLLKGEHHDANQCYTTR
jgi:hypothetical protein